VSDAILTVCLQRCAALDPSQDGYHDTSTRTTNDDPAPMGDLSNTHRVGRESLSLNPRRGGWGVVIMGRIARGAEARVLTDRFVVP